MQIQSKHKPLDSSEPYLIASTQNAQQFQRFEAEILHEYKTRLCQDSASNLIIREAWSAKDILLG